MTAHPLPGPRQRLPIGRGVRHRVASELITRIDHGVYARGSWLPTEQELLLEFSVSRPALREALIMLQCLGLIEPRHSVGYRVLGARETPFDPSIDLVALLEACCLFEAESTALAAGLPGQRRAPEPPSGPPALERFHPFHLDLARATGNGALIASVRNLWDLALARPAMRGLFNAGVTQSNLDFASLQRSVVQAIETRDPGAARRAVKTLFDAYLTSVLDAEEAERLGRAYQENHRLQLVWRRRLSIEAPEDHVPPGGAESPP